MTLQPSVFYNHLSEEDRLGLPGILVERLIELAFQVPNPSFLHVANVLLMVCPFQDDNNLFDVYSSNIHEPIQQFRECTFILLDFCFDNVGPDADPLELARILLNSKIFHGAIHEKLEPFFNRLRTFDDIVFKATSLMLNDILSIPENLSDDLAHDDIQSFEIQESFSWMLSNGYFSREQIHALNYLLENKGETVVRYPETRSILSSEIQSWMFANDLCHEYDSRQQEKKRI